MMRIKFSIVLVISLLFSIISCKDSIKDDLELLQSLNDSIKNVYAPDKRVAIYDISLSSYGDHIKVTGQTDQEQALKTFVELAEYKGKKVQNLAKTLPDSSVGEYTRAIVNNSVANIRSKAKHSGELATQAILGTALKVLRIDGDFYLVQTPDGYISWVDHGGVKLLSPAQFMSWEKSQKVIFTKNYGFVYTQMGNELDKTGDIVLGSQLILLEEKSDYYRVQYPDKREGFLKKSESEKYETWLNDVQGSGSLIELYAMELMGAPYLWGGTSSKGMDCSGFTKTVYLMNGFVIPRDASQQIKAGKDIDPALKIENLEKGDLMFFGRKATDSTKQRVTHVAIWLGNGQGEFIHSAGRVKMGSIDKNSIFYDEFNTNRYLGSRRYLGVKDELLVNMKLADHKTEIKS